MHVDFLEYIFYIFQQYWTWIRKDINYDKPSNVVYVFSLIPLSLDTNYFMCFVSALYQKNAHNFHEPHHTKSMEFIIVPD